MNDHRTRADARALSDADRTQNDRLAADIHTISNHGDIVGAHTGTNRRAVPQHTVFSDHRPLMDDKADAMIQPQPGPDTGLVVEFDPQLPNHDQRVERTAGPTQPTKTDGEPVARLRQTKKRQNKPAARIPGIGRPILKYPRDHIGSRAVRLQVVVSLTGSITRKPPNEKPGS